MKLTRLNIAIILMAAFLPISAIAQGVFSSSFSSVEELKPGELASLSADDPTQVELSDLDNLERIVGVVVDGQQSIAHSSEPGKDVQVAISGTALTFVSNIAGDIEAGDLLTASPLKGVAMKADKEDAVLGRAEVAFNAEASEYIERDVSSELGDISVNESVFLGLIPVSIDVQQNPNNAQLAGLAGFAQLVTENLTASGVSPARLLIVLLIFLITSAFLITLLYGAITGSINSIGRNPLIKKDIFSSMYRVIGLSIVVLIAMVFVISIILR